MTMIFMDIHLSGGFMQATPQASDLTDVDWHCSCVYTSKYELFWLTTYPTASYHFHISHSVICGLVYHPLVSQSDKKTQRFGIQGLSCDRSCLVCVSIYTGDPVLRLEMRQPMSARCFDLITHGFGSEVNRCSIAPGGATDQRRSSFAATCSSVVVCFFKTMFWLSQQQNLTHQEAAQRTELNTDVCEGKYGIRTATTDGHGMGFYGRLSDREIALFLSGRLG